MSSIIEDIAKKQAEYKDVARFIEQHRLKPYLVDRIVEENLPSIVYDGKFYLIRNSGIIEVETGFSYQTEDIRFSGTGIEAWQCTVTFHNVSSVELNGTDTSCDIITDDPDRMVGFILALLKSKFVLYSK